MKTRQLQKKQIVSDLGQSISNTNTMIVSHYQGLTVKEIMVLRRRIDEIGGNFKVTKNSLVRLAVMNTGFEPLSSLFLGPTAIAFSDNSVALAKIMVDYAKENEKLIIKGGIIDSKLIDTNDIKALAALPSIEELRAKIIGTIIAPATKLVSVLQAPAGQLVRMLNTYSSK
ncbi:Ribosomal protein L10 [Rickettsiales bacterium Ac37b]|nr:Ribosomal protein L10 [Rickettsiales bacterium Ac37b]